MLRELTPDWKQIKSYMRIAFQLGHQDRICPSDGENTGAALARAGNLLLAHYQAGEGQVRYYGPWVAQIYHLAADAYEAGAAASIGHNRTDRYMASAKELRAKAAALGTEGQG